MHRQIFVNLAVSDLKRSMAFFRGPGFYREPQDLGFMYGHGFEDLDGHVWELVHMSGNPPSA